MKFIIDNNGYPKVIEYQEQEQIIVDFLEGDIQRSLRSVNEYITLARDFLNNKIDYWEGTSNAHTVILNNNEIEIINEFTEDTIVLKDIDNFIKVLEQWKQILERL